MDYQTTLKYLYDSAPMFQQIGSKAYKEGLENTLELDRHFGHPHHAFRTIHIAGTNGKGSCSHTLAAVLQSAGYRVGLYTSPHLVDFRERIRINGQPIPEEYVIRFVEEQRSFFETLQPSFFELTTAMAFRYFADEKVDVAVIETGLGGRLDCTNIITPDLSVITNISFDHQQFLGNTLEKIATEKAGIIKKEIPVVIGEAEGAVKTVFERKAQELNSPIFFAEKETVRFHISHYNYKELEEIRKKTYTRTTENTPANAQPGNSLHSPCMSELPSDLFDNYLNRRQDALIYSCRQLDLPVLIGELTGDCQHENGRTILTALHILREQGYHIIDRNIQEGFACVCKMTGLMGRWQQLHSHPTIVCDTGHNVAGIFYILNQLKTLKEQNAYKQLYFVFGMVNDKDISSVLAILPKDATYYFTQASVERALPAEELAQQARSNGLNGNAYSTVIDAIRAAQEKSLPEDFIFVGGSSFIVADLLTNRDTLNLD